MAFSCSSRASICSSSVVSTSSSFGRASIIAFSSSSGVCSSVVSSVVSVVSCCPSAMTSTDDSSDISSSVIAVEESSCSCVGFSSDSVGAWVSSVEVFFSSIDSCGVPSLDVSPDNSSFASSFGSPVTSSEVSSFSESCFASVEAFSSSDSSVCSFDSSAFSSGSLFSSVSFFCSAVRFSASAARTVVGIMLPAIVTASNTASHCFLLLITLHFLSLLLRFIQYLSCHKCILTFFYRTCIFIHCQSFFDLKYKFQINSLFALYYSH